MREYLIITRPEHDGPCLHKSDGCASVKRNGTYPRLRLVLANGAPEWAGDKCRANGCWSR